MSGLYNMLFGRNPYADILMAMLGLTPANVGRYRDCYPNEDGTRILVYTRNGGGNREQYQAVIDELAKHPCYLSDCDDDFDCTYATIAFKVPEGCEEAVKYIADESDTRTGSEKFSKLISDLQAGKDNANTSRALDVGKQIFAKLEQQASGTVSTPDGSVVVTPIKPATAPVQVGGGA